MTGKQKILNKSQNFHMKFAESRITADVVNFKCRNIQFEMNESKQNK